MKKKLYLFVLMLILLCSFASAQDMLISNSKDWKDVYSVEIFGNIMDIDSIFLTGTRHATILHFSLPQDESLEVISSSDDPFVVGFDSMLGIQGLDDVSEVTYDNINLELARRLVGINKFIIVDDSYGYNALTVGSYASLAGYYVLFADDRNIGFIEDYLAEVGVDDLILFGQVDREVKTALEQYNPELISLGDRFDNNIEIVKKFLEFKPSKQTILTNGEFIEESLLDGHDPVLFIGKTNVPDQIQEYIQSSDIDIGILIGNELIGTATTIRRQVGISVFVKFAQGARTPGGTIAPVEDLDRFPMPSYILSLEVFSVFYNSATNKLEITYRNNANIATYLKGTINIFAGDQTFVLGDEEPIFIDENEFKTILYDLELIDTENATAEFFTIFGESKKSLEFVLQGTFPIEAITILDEAIVNITDVYYDAGSGMFIIEVKNIGTVDAYIDTELLDIWINGQLVTIGGNEVIKLKPGKTGKLKASVELTEEDMANRLNQEIDVKILYGERENALVWEKSSKFEFRVKEGDYFIYILVLVAILLLLLILFKRKKKCKDCKHMNPRRLDYCEKCGARL